MEVINVPDIPLSTTWALRRLTLRLTREGEQTPGIKHARLLNSAMSLGAAFSLSYEVENVFLASSVDGPWVVLAIDEQVPARAGARHLQIQADVILPLDLNDGSGSAGGLPAVVSATVRLNGMPASRDVVAVERQADDTWRVSGNGRTGAGGAADLDLRISGEGLVYALGLDDWGIEFQPNLEASTGQTIRPTLYTGWLFRITQAGTLPAQEPEWWTGAMVGPQALGTARAEAVRYYQPIAHGPFPVEPS